ncbi:MAG: hypothetical protein WD065_10960, partial [Planctomycetaceae bacterium]
ARSYMTFTQDGRLFERHTVSKILSRPAKNENNLLELKIVDGELQEVQFNNYIYDELTSDESQDQFTIIHNSKESVTRGRFGVLTQTGVFRFDNATWFTSKENY